MRVARVNLHHHVVLIDGAVNDRHLPLSERVVKGVVDLQRANAEASGGVAIDDDVGLQPVLRLIRFKVRQHGVVLKRLDKLRSPPIEVLYRVGQQRVLILRIALAAADEDILDGAEVEDTVGNLSKLWLQPRDDLINWWAFGQWL